MSIFKESENFSLFFKNQKNNLICILLIIAIFYLDRISKIKIINVPGVFEIPFTIRKYIKRFDGFLALGCVIKGETPHFDLICHSTFNAILKLSINYNKPIGNGIITSFNKQQAFKRSSINKKLYKPNKGSEAANAVISIFNNEPKN